MARARINENGELVNAETGEVLGNIRDKPVVFNSNGAESKSLEELGVLMPDPPDENSNERREVFSDEREIKSDENQERMDEKRPVDEKLRTDANVRKVNRPAVKSKYFVNDDSFFIIRFGLVQKEDGRFMPIRDDLVMDYPNSESHWVKFRMWNYAEELKWKSDCMEYSSKSKTQVLNFERLNEMKIRFLMLEWSFGEYDDRLRLLHCDGRLSDESYGVFMGMYPSIANTIVDMMNSVLENHQ